MGRRRINRFESYSGNHLLSDPGRGLPHSGLLYGAIFLLLAGHGPKNPKNPAPQALTRACLPSAPMPPHNFLFSCQGYLQVRLFTFALYPLPFTLYHLPFGFLLGLGRPEATQIFS